MDEKIGFPEFIVKQAEIDKEYKNVISSPCSLSLSSPTKRILSQMHFLITPSARIRDVEIFRKCDFGSKAYFEEGSRDASETR